MASLVSFLVLLALASTTVASRSVIRMFPEKSLTGLNNLVEDECESLKFSFEANNLRELTVPKACEAFVEKYMYGSDGRWRYFYDSMVVVESAHEFAKKVKVNDDGKDAWILGVDETMVSNLAYYAEHGFGSETFNETAFDEWVEKANAPPAFHITNFYRMLQQLGFKIIIVTGRDEPARHATELNLKRNGYSGWEKLIMRGAKDQGKTALAYKSEKIAELVKEGYRFHGNMGDQWSDLLSSSPPTRTFKYPNPMYYVP